MSNSPATDPLDGSHWGPVWRLLHSLDNDIAELYRRAGVDGVRTRFVGPLIQIDRHGPQSIQELADRMEVTHSAMSQTVAAMRHAGLVDHSPGADARTRRITLTKRARELVPFLRAEWRATEASIRELESELPYPLTRVVADIQAALARRPFRDRLAAHLPPEHATEPRRQHATEPRRGQATEPEGRAG
ncbi:MarR family winged helix-turn-helix transcriptional regulator [Plantactinospora sp. GCM10030261]|uniref:MarR family winged helix-turn-helix transcriptional regulator n=1 Tax=Plantactinospora sp. GCM10030261 TaxID=3273420 RepID=UPI003622F3A2